jgi:hypothetical protein
MTRYAIAKSYVGSPVSVVVRGASQRASRVSGNPIDGKITLIASGTGWVKTVAFYPDGTITVDGQEVTE